MIHSQNGKRIAVKSVRKSIYQLGLYVLVTLERRWTKNKADIRWGR